MVAEASALAQSADEEEGKRVKRRSTRRRLFLSFLLPLFFVVCFPLAYVSAFHAPAPNNLNLLVVGPQQVVSPIAAQLEAGSYVTQETDVAGAAETAVRERRADGAISVAVSQAAGAQPTFTVTTYIAGGGGTAQSAAVKAAGAQIAAQFGVTSTVRDVAPLAGKDSLGTALFYLLIVLSLGGYLVIVVIHQVWPAAGLRVKFVAAAATAVAAPVLTFALMSIFVGSYGAGVGAIAALLGVAMLYVFTVACAMILAGQFLDTWITFAVMGFIVFLNFPSAGGAIPAHMLPDFWQNLHSIYFGAGAMESFRSIVYFGGNGATRWILQLAAWTVALLAAVTIVALTRTVRRHRVHLAALSAFPAAGDRHLLPLTMPENHLDMVISPNSVVPERSAPLAVRIGALIAMPLFFILSFSLSYTSALHAPTPNGFALTIAGPAAVSQQLADAIDQRTGGAFSITQRASLTDAVTAVTDRDSVGAISVDGNTVTAVIASGGSKLTAGTVESLAGQVAQQLGGTVTVKDVAPLAGKDPTGSSLFFLIIIATVAGFLTVTALTQIVPVPRLGSLIVANVVTAVAAPLVGFAVMSIFLGAFGATFADIAAVLAVMMLYTLAAGLIATLFTRILGQVSVLGVILVLVALNFPSSGGPVPAAMLPGFWHELHGWWIGSSAFEAIRSIIYFNGAQTGTWVGHLSVWAVAVAAVLAVFEIGKRARNRRHPETAEPTAERAAVSA
ncbi:hypothetical protein ABZS66_58005 [Dactylosporangium sp. NPDC005572]|uniref:hypothetical protein n=1 Tax=Dactylosporangium sp. NPDC005572 TaxID=3156889 RepID=UPI0033B5D460